MLESWTLFIPVPIPVMISTGSLNRAQEIEVADVVFEIPISPNISKSQLEGIESKPNCMKNNTSSSLIALLSEKSIVGLSKSIGITDNLIFAKTGKRLEDLQKKNAIKKFENIYEGNIKIIRGGEEIKNIDLYANINILVLPI